MVHKMLHFVLLVLLSIASSQLVEKKLFFYQASNDVWHVNEGEDVLAVINGNDFPIQSGYGLASYTRHFFNITLSSYSYLSNPEHNKVKVQSLSETKSYNACPLYHKKVMITVYRVQHRHNKEGCVSEETVRRYMQYMDSHLRLQSGGRIRMDIENSIISNICCPCSEEECYGPDDYGNFMTKVSAQCQKLDRRLKNSPMTRIYLNDGFGGFAGLASLGWIDSFANYDNYWAINNINNDPDEEWKWDYNLSVLLHEFGHTMGYGHAGWTKEEPTSFLTFYDKPDNYGDGGSIMGGGSSWDTIPGPGHYYYRLSKEKVEPFYFKMVDKPVVKTIRLFAWDHPYSRPFLGIEEARFQDDDMIDGIRAADNMMTLEVPYNKADMCSQISSAVTFGSFYLEYRSKRGKQQGAANRGVRLMMGRWQQKGADTTRTVMLPAGVDGLFSWADNVIPAGVVWTPDTADRGTIGLQIKKIHSVSDSMNESQLDDPVQPLSNIPYMEIEVTYMPNIRYIPPLHPSPLPSYTYSPNILSCTMNEASTGYDCVVMGENRYWFYMNDFSQRGHPRIFRSKRDWVDSASISVVSLPGREYSGWTHYYGDYTRGNVSMTIQRVNSPGSSYTWYNTQLFSRKTNEDDSAFKEIGTGNVVIVTGLQIESNDKLYLMDLYGYSEELKVKQQANDYLFMFPERTLPGCYEGYIIKKRDNSIIYSQRLINLVDTLKENRVAIELINEDSITVSSAGIPTSMTSYPSMIQKQKLSKNSKLPVMFHDWTFGDYLLIDFEGKFPSDCILYLETDDGVKSIELYRLSKERDISFKLSYRQLINMNSFDGQIHYIWFSKTVTLLSIRPVLQRAIGKDMDSTPPAEDYFNIDDIRYKGIIKGFNGFVKKEYTGEFNGKKYQLNTDDTTGIVVNVKNYSAWEKVGRIFMWIGITIGIIIIIIIIMAFISCSKRRSSRPRKQLNATVAVDMPSSKPVKKLQPTGKRTASVTDTPPLPKAPKPKDESPKVLPPQSKPKSASSSTNVPPLPKAPKPMMESPKALPPLPKPKAKDESPKALPPKPKPNPKPNPNPNPNPQPQPKPKTTFTRPSLPKPMETSSKPVPPKPLPAKPKQNKS